MFSYDKKYSSHSAVFGENPEKILVDHFKKIENSKPVLDIGAGQGRHALFLAENGYAVEALEPSEVGIKQMEQVSSEKSLPLFLTHADIKTFEAKADAYSAVLLFGILQVLPREEIEDLLQSIKKWTSLGSMIFVIAFSTEEPSYAKHKQDDKEVGKHSYLDAKGFLRTYLEPNEILQLFADYEVVHHDEHLTEAHHHGDGNIHRHAVIEAVFRVQ
ncbi:MAG: class I SAM-dependent methyltransferase [Calditrichaeota bacterium]|nr:MAG: class I SAM-dependent methyltransferase [Calditrichota bacterium]